MIVYLLIHGQRYNIGTLTVHEMSHMSMEQVLDKFRVWGVSWNGYTMKPVGAKYVAMSDHTLSFQIDMEEST